MANTRTITFQGNLTNKELASQFTEEQLLSICHGDHCTVKYFPDDYLNCKENPNGWILGVVDSHSVSALALVGWLKPKLENARILIHDCDAPEFSEFIDCVIGTGTPGKTIWVEILWQHGKERGPELQSEFSPEPAETVAPKAFGKLVAYSCRLEKLNEDEDDGRPERK